MWTRRRSAGWLWLVSLAGACAAPAVRPKGEPAAAMVVIEPGQIPWQAASIHPEAKALFPYGDPVKGPHIQRWSFPAGVITPVHTHPYDEFLTVLSGTLRVGEGERVVAGEERPLGASGYVIIPAGTPHWARAAEDVEFLVYAPAARGVNVIAHAPDQQTH